MTNKELIKMAKSALKNSYSPYSKTKVGAALISKDGNIFTGFNIENASYGLSICAERVAVYNALTNGMKKSAKIAIASNRKREFTPCGACRQVLLEFYPEIDVIWKDTKGKIRQMKLKELLPCPYRSYR